MTLAAPLQRPEPPALNALVAARFRRLADLLEIEGANPFRIRAYRRAAVTVERLGPRLAQLLARSDALSSLDALPGIGDDLAEKIVEVAHSGRLLRLDETQARVPPGLIQLLALPGIGPKRVRRLHAALGVRSIADLRRALGTGAVGGLPGFGVKLVDGLRSALSEREQRPGGWPLAVARPQAQRLRDALAALPGIRAVTIAGSIRRGRPVVGDIDLVAVADPDANVTQKFAGLADVAEALARGETQARVRLSSGLQADLWVATPEAHGAALIHATGSKAHNIALRRRAQARGLRLNEYGLHRGRRRIAGRTEAEIYAALGLAEVLPARREGLGEIEAAELGAGRGMAA